MRVRPAAAADLAKISAIAAANPLAPQWTASQFAEILAPKDGVAVKRTLLVAECEGMVTGFAVVSALTSVYPVEAELESVAVDSEWKRQGVGRLLLKATIAWARSLSARDLRLEVRAGNHAAMGLYASQDFRHCGMRRSYYANPPEDAVCMVLLLAASAVSV